MSLFKTISSTSYFILSSVILSIPSFTVTSAKKEKFLSRSSVVLDVLVIDLYLNIELKVVMLVCLQDSIEFITCSVTVAPCEGFMVMVSRMVNGRVEKRCGE